MSQLTPEQQARLRLAATVARPRPTMDSIARAIGACTGLVLMLCAAAAGVGVVVLFWRWLLR